ncbi:PH domain-containing protein [Gordonia sp. ABSL1-1]|uniref:PH domain-containing protein n=1 Tax=Gordonia sp. ABSL1-1 TaxID=3053923 RepID=UPI002574887C|nr:PH domain-containing protein [Gordonia sp. ABSL1-1]MDL9936747.1 PH domain-containing protein [Gordonia sp. ABSL1-1]
MRPDEWRRLSPWMMAVKPVEQLPQLVPVLIALVFAGQGAPLFSLVATVVIVPMVTVVPWLTTRYQVTDEHVRVRSGLLTRKVATARRDRIRGVDLTASPVHRILRLQKVTIGTGGDKGSTVELAAVPTAEARVLHGELMAAGAAAGPRPSYPGTPSEYRPTPPPPVLISRFDTSWLRFAPFSAAGFATAAAAIGLATQSANEAGVFDRGVGGAEQVADSAREVPVGLVAAIALLVVLAIGTTLSVAGYVFSYWGFTLSRHGDGTLRTERGLLTTNAVSFDEARIRGVHLHEPLLMRPVRGARLHAIATGSHKHPMLLPPAPRAEALRVGNTVAGEGAELTAPLARHPRAALRRRLTRAAWPGIAIVAVAIVAVIAGASAWLLPPAAVLAVALCLVGIPRYRNLGGLLTARSVVIAPPRVARHRQVVGRDGIIGWTSRTSWFQRRAGVTTLTVATAAGAQGYAAVDIDPDDATALIRSVSPTWIGEFLVDPDHPVYPNHAGTPAD